MDCGLFFTFCACAAARPPGRCSEPGDWYERLKKPSWTPPNWLFPVAWTTLYLCMSLRGDAGGAAARQRATRWRFWALQIALNTLWTPVFFGLRRMRRGDGGHGRCCGWRWRRRLWRSSALDCWRAAVRALPGLGHDAGALNSRLALNPDPDRLTWPVIWLRILGRGAAPSHAHLERQRARRGTRTASIGFSQGRAEAVEVQRLVHARRFLAVDPRVDQRRGSRTARPASASPGAAWSPASARVSRAHRPAGAAKRVSGGGVDLSHRPSAAKSHAQRRGATRRARVAS